ncbi:MAG: hypothetical protein IRY99_19860, partial [Isosphaeraceae bacterium]|nr:hypothetical protein [Isosphaeraceae bacterium]
AQRAAQHAHQARTPQHPASKPKPKPKPQDDQNFFEKFWNSFSLASLFGGKKK